MASGINNSTAANTSGTINDELHGTGGEAEGSQVGVPIDSTGDTTTYTVNHGNGTREFDPDYIVDLGEGYTLLVMTEEGEDYGAAVIVDAEGNMIQAWGDPHLTGGDGTGTDIDMQMEFKGNISFELPHGVKVSMQTSEDTNSNGMTWMTGLQVAMGTDEGSVSDDSVVNFQFGQTDAGVTSVQTYNGQAAADAENQFADGQKITVGEAGITKEGLTFHDQNGDAMDSSSLWQTTNDGTNDFAHDMSFIGETVTVDTSSAIDALRESFESLGDLPLGLLMLVVFQDRQDVINDTLTIEMEELQKMNGQASALNELLASINAAQGDGDENTEITLDSTEMELLKDLGVLDLDDPDVPQKTQDAFGEPNEKGEYKVPASVVKELISGKSDSLTSASQQQQQQIQFNFSNLTTASETLTSSMKSFYDMLSSIARNAGG